MDHDSFEVIVDEVILELPSEFQERLQNIELLVADEPPPELLARMKIAPNDLLLGAYDGIPLTKRRHFTSSFYPDRIWIFKGNIETVCTPDDVKEKVRTVVLHEIAHFFGIDDNHLHELGF